MSNLKNELNEIYIKYNLIRDKHIYYDKEGGYTIFTRLAILKIAKIEKIEIVHDVFFHNNIIVVRATSPSHKTDALGEASPENNTWPYPVSVAEKRSDSRLVIKIILEEFEEVVMGEEELTTKKPEKGELVLNELKEKLKTKK